MKKRYLKGILGIASIAGVFLMASCSSNTNAPTDMGFNPSNNNQTSVETVNVPQDNEVIDTIDESVNQGDFTIETEDGLYEVENNIYTITKGGTYTLSGVLEGNVIVDVKEANADGIYDVVLELEGATIISNTNSPIYAKESDSISYDLEISAKKDTTNIVKDTRSLMEEDMEVELAAIYSEVDLKLKGKGILYVYASYNNGIHTKDDLKIKNLTLSVTAPNNALKGNDSVTIESGALTIISTGGDGIKTSNSSLKSSGTQKGTVQITGGEVTIYSLCDGIDAAYDVEISSEADVEIYTSNYSKYSGEVVNSNSSILHLRISSRGSQSYRYAAFFYDDNGNSVWVNAESDPNQMNYAYYKLEVPSGYNNVIYYQFNASQTENSTTSYVAKSNGETLNTNYDMVTLKSSNSLLSTSYGVYSTQSQQGGGGQFGPGGMGMQEGNTNKSEYSAKGIKASNQITVSGGSVVVAAYDDALHANNEDLIESTSTYGLGNILITGGSLVLQASDDGIHADNTITIEGSALVNVKTAYEGIEANQIYFNGGQTYVYATDDAVNATTCGVSTTPCVYVNDSAYVDLDVASGDTDTLDSNGNIKMTGGYLVVKNRQSQASSQTGGTIDIDGSFTMTGGVLISFGTWCNEVSMSATKSSTSSVSAGTYYIKDSSGNAVFSTTLATSYTGYRIISKLSGSYSLYNGSTLVTSF